MASRVDSHERADFAARIKAGETNQGLSAAPPAEADAADNAPYQGMELVAADALSDLHWDAESIRLILAGPDSASIHQIANRQLNGSVFEGVPGEPMPDKGSPAPNEEPEPADADEVDGAVPRSSTEQPDAALRSPVDPTLASLGSTFGELSNGMKHLGVDLFAPDGTPVVSAIDGVVIAIDGSDTMVQGTAIAEPKRKSRSVWIIGADYRQYRYFLLSQVMVRVGQTVSSGQQIGTLKTHLHFEIRIRASGDSWEAIDPLLVLPKMAAEDPNSDEVTSETTADKPSAKADPAQPEDKPVILEPKSLYWPTSYGQAAIVQAIWANLHGDTMGLAELARNLKSIPPVLQAYTMAAVKAGKRNFEDLKKWLAEFTKKEGKLEAERAKKTKEAQALAGQIVGAAIAAANAIPVAGQVVSAILAVGLAINQALVSAFPIPGRLAEDQVRDGYEGITVFFGLTTMITDDRYLVTKQAVVQDVVAFQLPHVPLKTPFPFAPTVDDFKEAAESLSLYDGQQ